MSAPRRRPTKPHLTAPVPSTDLPQPNPEALKARCFDPKWRYYGKDATDVARTFARIRKQQKAEAEAHKPHVVPVKRSA